MPPSNSPRTPESLSDLTTSSRVGRTGWAVYGGLLLLGMVTFLVAKTVGEGLSAPPAPSGTPAVGQPSPGQVHLVLHLLATLASVIACGFVLGRLVRRLGQPPVIGEVIAGIVLGPSLLGMLSPATMHLLIPSAASDPHGLVPAALQGISQLGVILYMFLVGLELNASRLRDHVHTTIAVSHSSIVVPFALGMVLALGLYPRYSHAGVPFVSFALFQGAAMAITAFPILARILTDRGLDKTDLGNVALGCAATGDVTAWCILALVVGVAQSEYARAITVIGGAIAFVAVMLVLVRPLLERVVRQWDRTSGPLPAVAIPATFLAVLLAALATEAIGIHAVFGAFLLGALIPEESRIAREITHQLKVPVTVLLLPAFFACTGLRTQIGLVSGWQHWLWCLAIIGVATLGKFGGSLFAARLAGLSWQHSTVLGALMNTRGLMELIVLNIGLDLGVISPTLFAMMVIMALATTAMTAPVLNWVLSPPQGQPPAA